MITNQAIVAQRLLTKQRLFNLLSDDADTVNSINKAFDIKDDELREHLLTMFNEDEVNTFFAILHGVVNSGPQGSSNNRNGPSVL